MHSALVHGLETSLLIVECFGKELHLVAPQGISMQLPLTPHLIVSLLIGACIDKELPILPLKNMDILQIRTQDACNCGRNTAGMGFEAVGTCKRRGDEGEATLTSHGPWHMMQ